MYRDVEPPTFGHVESPDDCHPGMSLHLLSYFSTKALPWGLAALGVFTGSKLLLFPIQVPPPLRTSQDKTAIKIIPPADLQDPAGLCLCLCLCNYDLGEHLEVYKHIGKIRSFLANFRFPLFNYFCAGIRVLCWRRSKPLSWLSSSWCSWSWLVLRTGLTLSTLPCPCCIFVQ